MRCFRFQVAITKEKAGCSDSDAVSVLRSFPMRTSSDPGLGALKAGPSILFRAVGTRGDHSGS